MLKLGQPKKRVSKPKKRVLKVMDVPSVTRPKLRFRRSDGPAITLSLTNQRGAYQNLTIEQAEALVKKLQKRIDLEKVREVQES